MSDKILLILLFLCLGFGGYKLISNKFTETEPTEPAKMETAPDVTATPEPEESPEPKPLVVEEKILPSKISSEEVAQLFRIDGIAQGLDSRIVMINNSPLHEGETLDGLKIEKILANHVEVSYQGHSYQLAQQLLQQSNN